MKDVNRWRARTQRRLFFKTISKLKVYIRTPYSLEKNLGKAYNEEMAMIPEGQAACFIDGDTMFLTPDYGHILHEYANKYPDAVLTCWTNRIHELSKGQRRTYNNEENRNDIIYNVNVAISLKGDKTTSAISGPVSGFLLVVPKSVWHQHKFTEENKYNPGQPNLLGVDNDFTNRVRAAGVPVLKMNGLLVWHSYRLLDGSKKHLV